MQHIDQDNYPLSLEEFREWLESKDVNDVVGWQGWCKGCPIFKCIKDKDDKLYSVNYESSHFLDSQIVTVDNPSWVKTFINKIDDSSIIPLKQGEMNTSITAQQALEVLDNLHICTVCNKYNPEGKNCGRENCDW